MSPPPEQSTTAVGDQRQLPGRVLSALGRPGVTERITTAGTIRLDTLRGDAGGTPATPILISTAAAFTGGGLVLLRPGAAADRAGGGWAAGRRGSNDTGRGEPPA